MNLMWRPNGREAWDAESRAARPRLAIVSTYDELCGIAGYTRALVRQLEPFFEITVFDLDQYLMRSPHARVQKLGNRFIATIAAELRGFDAVNIQLEHGTLGRYPWQILRRLRHLIAAAPALSVTFHTILEGHGSVFAEFWRAVRRFDVIGAYEVMELRLNAAILTRHVYRLLRFAQRRKSVSVITHTRRDMRLLRDVYRLRNVYHHPLSFVSPAEAAVIRAGASRDAFPLLRSLPETARLIGTFGFLSEYKGFETAIKALDLLPDDHHLLVFGAIHPQTIQPGQRLDPYLATLLRTAKVDHTIFDDLGQRGASVSLAVEASMRELFERHPRDLSHRVHFMGALTDEAFMRAMAVCDAVVLPYVEVGQSSSGPISMALDMGCRVIASRTLAFLQFARYHPHRFEMFDIGNFVELADRLRSETAHRAGDLAFNTETNAAIYRAANSRKRVPGAPLPELRSPLGQMADTR